MRSWREERFRHRLYQAQLQVPDNPGPRYERALASLVNARLAGRYDEPPRGWLRLANSHLGAAYRELARIQSAPRQPARRSGWAQLAPAMAVIAVMLAGGVSMWEIQAGPPPPRHSQVVDVPRDMGPGSRSNQVATSVSVRITNNSTNIQSVMANEGNVVNPASSFGRVPDSELAHNR